MRKKKKSRQCWDFKVTRGTLLRFGLTEYLIASRAAVKVLAFFEKLPPCLVGIEACASSHHWSRELQALGHTVRLMPPAYVKPYVERLAAMMHRRWEDFSAEQQAPRTVGRSPRPQNIETTLMTENLTPFTKALEPCLIIPPPSNLPLAHSQSTD